MTIRFRTICNETIREFAFDRKYISIGQAPFNDIALEGTDIADIHGQLEIYEDGALAFRARASAMPTRVFRGGECTQSSDGVEEQVLHLRAGDTIWMGEAPAVRLEVIGVDLEAQPGWSAHPIAASVAGGLSEDAGQLFFRLSRALAQAPSVENFLKITAYFIHHGLGVLPRRVDLAVPIASASWRAEDFRLDAITLLGADAPEDQEVQGAYRRKRESLPIFRAQNADIFVELQKLSHFVLLAEPENDEPQADPYFEESPFGADPMQGNPFESEAYDDAEDPDAVEDPVEAVERARYQVLIPCALRGELAAVMSVYFPRSPEDAGSKLTPEAIGGFVGRLEPLAAMVLDSHRRARQVEGVLEENRYWRERQRRHHFHKDFIAESDAARKVYEEVNDCVSHDEAVLLLGEAGSGKALIARAIHHLSGRKNAMLTAINCRSLSGDDLDFELFGSAENELTGDTQARTGIFELAEGGTVFLEEIDRLSLMLQGKLLRMLRESEVRRTGEAAARPVNVRLIVSTHYDLRKEVEAGRFRRDLYVVLSRYPLMMPPLRERHEDILPLARTFLKIYRGRYDRACQRLSSDVEAIFLAHSWRGNVRELKSVIEAAVLQSGGDVIEVKHLGL